MYVSFHSQVFIKNLCIYFGKKDCIKHPFSMTINYGSKIAIIGRNGCGKSSLLKAIASQIDNFDGEVIIPDDVVPGYIPQLIIDNHSSLSGGQLFNQQLSQVISNQPNILFLDEPTNHLDYANRQSLIKFLKNYQGSVIVITHDSELLDAMDTIWHIYNQEVNVFSGNYSDYLKQHQDRWQQVSSQVKQLNKEKKLSHDKLMKEQQRAKKKKVHGEKKYAGDKLALRSAQGRGQLTANKNNAKINYDKNNVMSQLQQLYIPETVTPRFCVQTNDINGSRCVIDIQAGYVGYAKNQNVIKDINFQVMATEKVALLGNNGSGKSTLIKAIMGYTPIIKTGGWNIPKPCDIGYVDQHYSNLNANLTAVELLQQLVPNWEYIEIRDHLNSFLLRKNEEVNLAVEHLSGGEKLRLSLALIAAKMPQLLLLDEVTNNIDLETKEHLIQVLNQYPGAMILICHEQGFINQLLIDTQYVISNGLFSKKPHNIR